MSSLKKNFSIEKLYSDLEKYEANLNVGRDSRVRRNGSGASLHRVSTGPTIKKNPIEIKKASRLSKAKEENKLFVHPQRSAYSSTYNFQKCAFNECSNLKQTQAYPSKNNSIMKQNNYRNTENCSSQMQFSKSDEAVFLSECKKLYQVDFHENESSVKILLDEINKRDEIYELACKRIGNDCTAEDVREFFLSYERMKAIIGEFKRMSKLDIEDEQELYNFLRSEEAPDS